MGKRLSVFIFSCIGFSLLFTTFSFSEQRQLPQEIENRISDTIALSDLLTYAYDTNPSISSSKESWKVFIENYRIGTGYPDPQLMVTYFPSPIETRLGPQDWNVVLSQPIPFPGKLTQKGKILEADANISKLKLDKTIKNIVTSISTSFYELIYIQKAGDIARANFIINQELIKISETAYAQDRASFYDISKAQAQTAQIRYDILLLEELELTEKARINTLLNRTPDAPLGKAQDLLYRDVVYGLDEIYDLSTSNQEDVLIAQENVKKFEEAIKLSRYESLPSFKLGLFYAAIGEPDIPTPPKNAGDDAVGIQFGLNLPIWFGKNQSNVYKATASRQKAKADKLTITNQTKEKISRLWFKLQNSKRLITLYEKELIPQSMRSLQTAETWYRQGDSSFFDYLEVQATAYNFQLSLARAKADYGQTLVKLEQLAGIVLDKKVAGKKGENNS
ncbi:MAG: TolC family protein [Proteobacteria bacterium]|nr:TolC family protein [Pseudomonadota bacterium]MBU1584594.1 TolC family protein [Pseudomonadota bacterium]MBU2452468.1 TolC family protein [Pseudomonadota bacterium]MBU2628456.1 TolC family protein [Pseudomonadota bacterium]